VLESMESMQIGHMVRAGSHGVHPNTALGACCYPWNCDSTLFCMLIPTWNGMQHRTSAGWYVAMRQCPTHEVLDQSPVRGACQFWTMGLTCHCVCSTIPVLVTKGRRRASSLTEADAVARQWIGARPEIWEDRGCGSRSQEGHQIPLDVCQQQ
jgi:hypothetical protein